jgi:hypothetical protein
VILGEKQPDDDPSCTLRPPFRDFPADEWNVIEKGLHPEFLPQLETMLALGNGYLGMRGLPGRRRSQQAAGATECAH